MRQVAEARKQMLFTNKPKRSAELSFSNSCEISTHNSGFLLITFKLWFSKPPIDTSLQGLEQNYPSISNDLNLKMKRALFLCAATTS